MAQHFLLSPQAKTLSLAAVFGMKDDEAEMTFRRIRWHETDGQPVRSHCGGADAYDCRRGSKPSVDFAGYWQRHQAGSIK